MIFDLLQPTEFSLTRPLTETGRFVPSRVIVLCSRTMWWVSFFPLFFRSMLYCRPWKLTMRNESGIYKRSPSDVVLSPRLVRLDLNHVIAVLKEDAYWIIDDNVFIIVIFFAIVIRFIVIIIDNSAL